MIQNRFYRTFGLHRWATVALLLVLFALEGCVKRTDFEVRTALEGGIEIALEWETTATPIPLTFAFYSEGEDTFLYKEFEGTSEGFKGMLPVGAYKVLAYDKNALRVKYRNMDSYDTAEVYAEEAVKSTYAGDNRQIGEPGMVYSAGECVGMATLKIEAEKTLKAQAQPQNRTRSVMLRFEIKNGVNITTITGEIDGVSASVLLASGKSSNYAARLPFLVTRVEDGSFHTSVALFDFIDAESGLTEVHTMDVTLGEVGGATHDMTLDLTDTIREIVDENGGVIPIEIPIEVIVDMTDIEHITAIVHPWVPGEGGGEVIG